MKYNIYSIPNEVRGLEYLNLLYKNTMGQDEHGNIFELKKFAWYKALFIFNTNSKKNIIHIHWETNIYGSRFFLLSLFRMLDRFTLLLILKIKQVKIVWTMHNLEAHDYKHVWVDRLGKWIMWKLADKVIIQEQKIAEAKKLEKGSQKIVWIPQGNYIDVYGSLCAKGQKELKRQNGFLENDILLLALGSIRPYKELPTLIDQIEKVVNKGVKLHLLIAGKVSSDYKKIIENKVSGKSFVTLRPEFVPDEKIPEILAMADYTIYYYGESSLSSAAMIMSLSYGTPVITRNIPASEMVVHGKNGYVYKDNGELAGILQSFKSKSYFKPEEVIATISTQSWNRVASELRVIYIETYKS